jgi:predicted SAM-dependent methyltransferase
MVKFNIGCGWRDFGKDWINIDGGDYDHLDSDDIFIRDYDNGSADLIYASHFIEYFDRVEVVSLLERWKDVLKPNGILRLAVPDFKIMALLYTDYNYAYSLDDFLGPLYGKMKMDDEIIYHKTAYDYLSLKKLLEKIGMRDIKEYNWKETEHSQFDDHSQAYLPHMDKENGTSISLNVECTK